MIVDDRTNYVSAYGIVRTPPVRYAEESGPLCALIAFICALFFTKESVNCNTIADDGFTNGHDQSGRQKPDRLDLERWRHRID